MSVQKINKSNLETVKNSKRPVLLDFYAQWCGPCRTVGPILEALASEREDYMFAKVNVAESPDIAKEYGVFSIPTMVVLNEGREVSRAVGLRSRKQLSDMLDG